MLTQFILEKGIDYHHYIAYLDNGYIFEKLRKLFKSILNHFLFKHVPIALSIYHDSFIGEL